MLKCCYLLDMGRGYRDINSALAHVTKKAVTPLKKPRSVLQKLCGYGAAVVQTSTDAHVAFSRHWVHSHLHTVSASCMGNVSISNFLCPFFGLNSAASQLPYTRLGFVL